MKHLIITEKHSVAKDIAKVLGITTEKNQYMENDEYIIGWAQGHLIAQKQPYEILQKENKECWDISLLPFRIDQNKDLKVIKETAFLYKTLKELINRDDVDYIINAGDSGREGELIQRWTYKLAGNRKPIKRYWNSDNSKNGIKKSLENLEESSKYDGMYEEGKALKLIDWMYGMSYTVALTKIYGNTKDGKAIHYGRCQTPLLNLIALRELEIKNFKKEKYSEIECEFKSDNGIYKGISIVNAENKESIKYKPEEVESLINDIKEGNTASIYHCTTEEKESTPDKLFSMITLQQHLGKKYGYSPDKTLELAQSLYEKGYTSYPRTDSEYLTDAMWEERKEHIDSCIDFIKGITKEDLEINYNKEKSKNYVDNSKIEDHYAIIPTSEKADINTLKEDEKNAYIEICKRFIGIFMDNYKYKSTEILTYVETNSKKMYLFKTTGNTPISYGYKELYRKDIVEKDEDEEVEEKEETLPVVKEGINVSIENIKQLNKETKPPQRYNVGNITKLMQKNHIGTQATMSEIIKKVIDSGVVRLEKKKYFATELGLEIISIIPDELKTVELAERIENKLQKIKDGTLSLKDLESDTYNEQVETIKRLQEEAKDKKLNNVSINSNVEKKEKETIFKCPFCNGDMVETDIAYSHRDYKDNPCKFSIFKETLYTKITKTMAKELIEKGKTIGTFKSKAGKNYKQYIILNKDTKKLEKGDYVNEK